MRKKLLSILVLSILVASTLVGCATSTLTILSITEGDVFVMKAGTGRWIEAEVGVSLKPGDIIKTGDDSNAEITFFDGSTVELQAGTEIELLLLDVSRDTGSTTIRLGQTIGSIVFRVTKIVDPASRYEAETPTGVAAVRGSVMQIDVIEDGTTLITNLEGDIWAVAQGVELQVPQGEKCIVRPDEPPRLISELSFMTFWPETDFQAAMGHANWARTLEDRVAAETDHTLKINMRYGVPPVQIWHSLREGGCDIGVTSPSYHAGMFRLWDGPHFPADIYRNNALTMSLTIQALYDEPIPLQEEMAAQGLKVMHFWSTGPGYFLMTPGNEVRTMADFAGKRIRASNPASVPCIDALGAEPLYVPISVALEKFEAGWLDGLLIPTDVPKGFGVGAYVKHCTFAPFSYQHVFMKVMNETSWNALPADVQTIFNEVNAAWPEYYGKLRTWGEADGLEYMKGLDGFTYYDLPNEDPEEYQNWVDATAHLIDEWIGGDATRQALWDKFVELDQYYATTEPWSTWTPEGTPPPVPTFP